VPDHHLSETVLAAPLEINHHFFGRWVELTVRVVAQVQKWGGFQTISGSVSNLEPKNRTTTT